MKLWSGNPDMGVMETKVGRINKPEIISSNVNNNSVNVHYDSVVQINGDVHGANCIVKQMESVADKAIKKSWHDFEMTRKYGSY